MAARHRRKATGKQMIVGDDAARVTAQHEDWHPGRERPRPPVCENEVADTDRGWAPRSLSHITDAAALERPRTFDEVEHDIEAAYLARKAREGYTWEEARGPARAAWDKVRRTHRGI